MLATLLAALKEGVSFGSCRPTVVSQILRVWECGEEPGEVDYRNIFLEPGGERSSGNWRDGSLLEGAC